MNDLERVQGITVRGVQRMENESFILCTDPETGTTFAVHPGETIGTALSRVKARYREALEKIRRHAHGIRG
jgi:hypothetical protein